MQTRNNLAHVFGVIFIVIGVVAFFIILLSFDWDYYNSIKSYRYTYSDEIEILQQQLTDTWISSIVILIVNVSVGIVLMTLGKMLGLLEVIAIKIAGEENKSDDIKENVN